VITFYLPMPPTINHYYGQSGKRKFISDAGKKFRAKVQEIVAHAGHAIIEGRVMLAVSIYPSSKRKQDLDNRLKPLQDALTHAGVWIDDEQIDVLHVVRREVVKGGYVTVVITELSAVKQNATQE
jgi:crossover junction endodeoxyribonuclease RusA